VNDVLEGESTIWFDNGNLSEEDFYKQGKLDGEIKTYFFNGSPKNR
jgi:antitoxin component YwqK of YwqJK toxin-antitoxin module